METKKIKSRTELVIYILAILGVLVGLNYIGSKIFRRVDMTEGKQYSVSQATKKILKNLNDIVNVKVYFSKNLPPNVHQTVTDVKDLLSEYEAFAGKNLRISIVDPAESEELKQEARSLGIPELQMQTFEKDKAQAINCYMGIAVLYEDKKESIPVVQNLQNLEYDLTMAIMKVSRASVPKVGILKVDTMPYLPPNMRQQMNMQDETEQKFAPLFENLRQNYDVTTVDISEGQPIDSSLKTLVIPGGTSYTERKIFEIDQYFMKGGNLIVLVDPAKISFEYGANATLQESKLFDLVEHYGVKVEKNLVLDPSCGQVTIPQRVGPFSMNVPVPYPYFVLIGQGGFNKDNPAVAPLSNVIFPWTSSLTLVVDANTPNASVKSTVLAQSTNKAWAATGFFDLNPQQKWAPPAEKDLRQYNLAVYLNGKFASYFAGKSIPAVKEASATDTLNKINVTTDAFANREIIPSKQNGHLVVISDADFVSGQNATQPNLMLMQNVVDWLSLDDNLISIRTRAINDRSIEQDQLKKGSAKPNIIRIINIVAMPILIIILGLIIFIRRRETIPTQATSTTVEKAEVNK